MEANKHSWHSLWHGSNQDKCPDSGATFTPRDPQCSSVPSHKAAKWITNSRMFYVSTIYGCTTEWHWSSVQFSITLDITMRFNNSFYHPCSFVHKCDWYWCQYGKVTIIGKKNINIIQKSHISCFWKSKRTDRPNIGKELLCDSSQLVNFF